jgi:hypothetical protein
MQDEIGIYEQLTVLIFHFSIDVDLWLQQEFLCMDRAMHHMGRLIRGWQCERP